MSLGDGNQSSVTTFILLGFSEYPHLQTPLFLVFLTIYTVTLVGNLGIIVVIKINPKLHTPMYFFLSHLSFLDICYSSVFTPKLIEILVMEDRTISFKGCMVQFFFVCAFVITEMFMLAVMAYDRFVAVCNPLLYTVAMSQKLCALLVAGTYAWGGICSLTLTYSLLELSYCGSNIINHFGCEYSAILSLSCSDPYFSQMTCLAISTFNEACSLLIIPQHTRNHHYNLFIQKIIDPCSFLSCLSKRRELTLLASPVVNFFKREEKQPPEHKPTDRSVENPYQNQ
uniref:olfactory receptor 5D18-like n=1 Tax=Halichoerus grypus TaxID=9711 RepID=UPI001659E6A5|nr:olfactory receptor 5D18-like [Halichoerus grypus]